MTVKTIQQKWESEVRKELSRPYPNPLADKLLAVEGC